MKSFSINIPIFNEEELLRMNTEKLIEHLDPLQAEYEIIIVSNGSTDRSEAIGTELARKYPRVRFFALPGKGVGRAFKKAVKEAKYEHIISMDIDLSVDLSFIKEAGRLLDDHVMVIGSKVLGSQKRSWIRKIGSGIYIFFSRLFFKLSFADFSIGAKGFQRAFVLKNIGDVDDHTGYVLNLAYLAIKEGGSVIEVPVKCVDYRKSRFNLAAEALYRFFMLFKLVFNSRRPAS